MNQLIIYSHFSPFSFNCAIKDCIVDEAKSLGHDTVLRDLYFMGFNPLLDNIDFVNQSKGIVSDDVMKEQKYVAEADVIIFVFPVWWNSMPAMIKGYIDRVLSFGFAYGVGDDGKMTGLLKGKRLMIFNTLGGDVRDDHDDAMKLTLDRGILGYCGFDVVLHEFYPRVTSVDDYTRKRYLEDVRKGYNKAI